jgi:hypothetical protein
MEAAVYFTCCDTEVLLLFTAAGSSAGTAAAPWGWTGELLPDGLLVAGWLADAHVRRRAGPCTGLLGVPKCRPCTPVEAWLGPPQPRGMRSSQAVLPALPQQHVHIGGTGAVGECGRRRSVDGEQRVVRCPISPLNGYCCVAVVVEATT